MSTHNRTNSNVKWRAAATLAMAVLLLFTGVGFVVTYHLQKWHWHSVQLGANESKHTVTLFMTRAQYEKQLVNKYEIRVQDEYFLVRSVQDGGDMLEITAVHDKYEKKLRNILANALQHPDSPSKSGPLSHWLKVTFSPATLVTAADWLPPSRLQFEILFAAPLPLTSAYKEELERPPLFG